MCGIFGLAVGQESDLKPSQIEYLVRRLFRLSESRGKDASGVALGDRGSIQVLKAAQPASRLIASRPFGRLMDQALRGSGNGHAGPQLPLLVMGHARMATNGAQMHHDNNQPVIRSGMVGIHNGIVINVDELWNRFPDMNRQFEVDTEVILALMDRQLGAGDDLASAVRTTFSLLEGMTNVALIFEDRNVLLLATNHGSLYVCPAPAARALIFVSERYFLERLLARRGLDKVFPPHLVQHLRPGQAMLVDLEQAKGQLLSLEGEASSTLPPPSIRPRPVVDLARGQGSHPPATSPRAPQAHLPIFDQLEREFAPVVERVARLRRCTRCVLPETMPFINFDSEGVCNYCRGYQPFKLKGREALERDLAPFRKSNGEPDCIVAFSGGRDSSYGLHYITAEMGMTPLAFTYDWGMVTDLARRNQSRVCGKLGLEHILVSADITRKRANIRRNVTAWLKRPDLGMVPMFMAGDKQYFYHAHQIAKHNNAKLLILSENLLETTHFKSGFCGIAPVFERENTYRLPLADKGRLVRYYGGQYLRNPAYINPSLLDTLGAFLSYYVMPHHFLRVYHYVPWVEEEVDRTLIRTYDWETSPDTSTTWRIGDGTASFYNYIYFVMGGFSENDTFVSNQIREGMMERAEGLKRVDQQNLPRFASMQWYCDAIGIDLAQAVRVINRAPKLYA